MKKINAQTGIMNLKMKWFNFVIVLLGFALALASCTVAQQVYTKISDAEKIKNLTERQKFVNDFSKKINSNGGLIIEDNSVYFTYEGDAETVSIAGDMNFWKPDKDFLKRISGTDFWYLKKEFEYDARLDYKIVVDGKNWILDPNNPIQTKTGFGSGSNSCLQMPEYRIPWETLQHPNTPKGTIQKATIKSDFTKKTYDLNIYLPPNFSTEKKYITIYFQDGSDYLNIGNAQVAIENLLNENQIQPFIGIFVTPTDRNQEYVQSLKLQYVDFFVKELVPFIDGKFPTITQPNARAVIGDSYGGSISARISFTHPEVFGNCGLHSCALWTDDFKLSKEIRSMEKQPIRIASVWGKYEETLTADMRVVSEVLKEKGYDIFSKEYNEGHSWSLWAATFDDLFLHLFPMED